MTSKNQSGWLKKLLEIDHCSQGACCYRKKTKLIVIPSSTPCSQGAFATAEKKNKVSCHIPSSTPHPHLWRLHERGHPWSLQWLATAPRSFRRWSPLTLTAMWGGGHLQAPLSRHEIFSMMGVGRGVRKESMHHMPLYTHVRQFFPGHPVW